MQLTFTPPANQSAFNLCLEMFNTPHVLIAGTVGSGKSVLLHNFIWSILGRHFPWENDPDGVQLVLIDPKVVELKKYKGVPHVVRYEYEKQAIIDALDDVIRTMDLRYKYMSQNGLTLYDRCYLVVVIDELGDLMTTNKKEILPRLQRIAQLGRAAKIKLVCASQSPSRKVIPAELTLNFTGLVALHCRSDIESRQIIGVKGAEKLPKYGFCLATINGGDVEKREIALLHDNDLNERINHWRNQNNGYIQTICYSDSKTRKHLKRHSKSVGSIILDIFISVIILFFTYIFIVGALAL